MNLPASPADFEAALRRIERGLATIDDALLIRDYVGQLEAGMEYFYEELRREQESSERLLRALNEAFNMGSGVYRP